MDSALQELMEGDPNEKIEAIIKFDKLENKENHVHIISQFGDIYTCRISRKNIEKVWQEAQSLKAPRFFLAGDGCVDNLDDIEIPTESTSDSNPDSLDFNVSFDSSKTPHKSVIAVLDWGFDFTCSSFRKPDGTSKFIAIWDQAATFDGKNKYGYGKVIYRDELNVALKKEKPFEEVGYHPDPRGYFAHGTHGTHVTGIASSIAPNADLIAVHLSTGKIPAKYSLGDSSRILEGLDFVLEAVGQTPCVVNMSLGSTGGCHCGTELVEQAIDAVLVNRKGLAICQSVGNYYLNKTHAKGFITKNKSKKLQWVINDGDPSTNELEIWMHGDDEIKIRLNVPDSKQFFEIELPEEDKRYPASGNKRLTSSVKKDIILGGRQVGRIYLRKNEPNTGKRHFDFFLYPSAPSGIWELELIGKQIFSGEFHAWIERDGSSSRTQSIFTEEDASSLNTTGTIANSKYGIAVGAYNDTDPNYAMGVFSSAGRVLDENNRIKPELIAPGVNIRSNKSASKGQHFCSGETTVKSGTSMAAPHVTGALALLFAEVGQALTIEETRHLLISSTNPYPNEDVRPERYGHGMLDIKKLLKKGKEYSEKNSKLQLRYIQNEATLLPKENKSIMENIETNILDKEHPPEEIDEGVIIAEKETGEIQALINPNHWADNMIESWQVEESRTPLQKVIQDFYPKEDVIFSENQILSQIPNFLANGGLNFVSDLFRMVAKPENKLTTNLEKGDILIRLGNGNNIEQALIVDPELMELGNDNLISSESSNPGLFIKTLTGIHKGTPNYIAKRITDTEGFLLPNQAIIRAEQKAYSEQINLSTILPNLPASVKTKWNTYIYIVGTDASGNSDYNIMRQRLIKVIKEKEPYLIMTFDFKAVQTTGGKIQFRTYYKTNSSARGISNSFKLPHSLNQVFRTIETNSNILAIRHLHFLTHFQNDHIYYSSHKIGFKINDVKASIRRLSTFKNAFIENPVIKIHGCQLDKNNLAEIGKYCGSQNRGHREKALNAIRARIKRSFVYQLANMLGFVVWAGPIGADSQYHCRYLSVADNGRRFCIDKKRFQRTLRFYETAYGQFFLRSRGEKVFDFTYHMKYKPDLLITNNAASMGSCVSQIPPNGSDYVENIPITRDLISESKPRLPAIMEERPIAGALSNNALIHIPNDLKNERYIAKGENPNRRIYIVTTGPHNRNIAPVKFTFKIKNKNDNYNLKDSFFMVRFLAQGANGGQRMIPFGGQKESFKRVSGGTQIEDDSSRFFTFSFTLDLLKKAYNAFPNYHRCIFDIEFYWQEYSPLSAWKNIDRYRSRKRFLFFVVNPIEIIDRGAINPNSLDVPDPFGDQFSKFILQNATSENIVFTISISTGLVNTNSNTMSSQIKTSQQNMTGSTRGVSATVEKEASFGLNIDKIISIGSKSKYSGTVSHSRTNSQTTTKELSRAYAHSQTFMSEFRTSYQTTITIAAPSKKNSTNQLYIKPKFQPHRVNIIDYSKVNEFGFAERRKIYRSQIIWRFIGYAIITKAV